MDFYLLYRVSVGRGSQDPGSKVHLSLFSRHRELRIRRSLDSVVNPAEGRSAVRLRARNSEDMGTFC